ncbi:DUF6545 domain-containing protein [Streptomyces sp. NPDC004667]|uniref:DUF6545 domain-containing protein n=1 Tax=Streptomyces sp. NPDC004667 TaxID=3154285 RepID=UPI0033B44355
MNVLLFLPCVGYFLASTPTIRAVNRITGISNLSALLVYCILTAYACTCLVLLEYWKGGSGYRDSRRRRVRTWKIGCCAVIVAMVGLFALGDVPVERVHDFDTYYAATPFITEMLLLYLLTYVAAAAAMTVVCWNWIVSIDRKTEHEPKTTVDRSLRVGLLVLVLASMANIIFGLFKLTAIGARWAGRDWDALSTGLSPFMSVSGVVVSLGLLVPAYGTGLIDRVWNPLLAIAALRPLWRLVRLSGPAPGNAMLFTPAWYTGPEQILLYRMTTIHDWMLELCAHCEEGVRELAYREAKGNGASERQAVAAGLAAMFTVAADGRAHQPPSEAEQSMLVVAALKAAEAEDPDLLVSISRALETA